MKVRNSILGVGLLALLLSASFVFYNTNSRLDSIEKELKYNHYWMTVKKVRSDDQEVRLKKLEDRISLGFTR